MCVCRCTAFKYQSPSVLGGRCTLWWGEHLAGLKLPVHRVRMHLLSPLSLISLWNYSHLPTCPSPLLHHSCGSTLLAGFGFCSDQSRDAPTNFFSHPVAGMVGSLLHSFIVSLMLHLLPLCFLFFLECWLQCMPGSPHYRFMSFGFF